MFWDSKKTLVTHNGGFHSDDIFACATLQIYLDQKGKEHEIIRTRDEKVMQKGDFVFDVGGKYNPEENRFDHHQKGGAGIRENSVPFAAFGLVWKKFGIQICENEKIVEEIDRKLAQPIDAQDNGVDVYTSNIKNVSPITFQDIAGSYYPDEGASEKEYYNAFLKLVALAKTILEKSITKAKKQSDVNSYMKNLYDSVEEKKFLVVEKQYGRFAVTVGAFDLPELLYVVYPSARDSNEWNIVATRKTPESMESKKPFPETWAGFLEADLQKITGVATAKFCHNGRFLCVAEDKQDAIELAKLSIKS